MIRRWGQLPLHVKFAAAFTATAFVFAAALAAIAGLLLSSQRRTIRALSIHVPALVEASHLEHSLAELDSAKTRLEATKDPKWAQAVERRLSDAARARASIAEDSLPVESEIALDRVDQVYGDYLAASDAAKRSEAFQSLESALARFRAPLTSASIRAQQAAKSSERAVLWMLPLMMALAAFAAWRFERYFAYQVIEPVESLALFAHNVGQTKEGAALPAFPRLEVRAVDEIGLLADSLDRMSKRLEDQMVRLKELDQLKSKFVSMVSHEFRIPLTAVSEYGEMLSEGVAGELTDRQREYIETITKNARRLSNLTENLLNLAKIEAGRFGVMKTRVDLPNLLVSVARVLHPMAMERGVALDIDDDGVPDAAGDSQLLELAMTNLIGNAIKYNRPNGTVRVTARFNGKMIDLTVADEGPGIPVELQPKLFSGFYRLAPSETKGMGLGLPITKEIVEAHGSSLEIKSKLGEGTRFRFTLEPWKESEV